MIIASTFGGKKVAGSMDRIWPMPKNSSDSLADRAKRALRRHYETEDKKKVKQIIDGRRT